MKKIVDIIIFFILLPMTILFWLFWLIFYLPALFLGRQFHKLIDSFERRTINQRRKEIIKRVEKGSRVLDVGAGKGYLAEVLKERAGCQVVCVDVQDFNQTDLPLKLFDGVNLPFKDQSFDFVILSYVLHHAEKQEELLKECARVCRGKILVLEDEPVLARSFFAKAHAMVYNFLYDLNDKVVYYSPSDWEKIFKKAGVEVVEKKSKWEIGAVMGLMKEALFVLENSKLLPAGRVFENC